MFSRTINESVLKEEGLFQRENNNKTSFQTRYDHLKFPYHRPVSSSSPSHRGEGGGGEWSSPSFSKHGTSEGFHEVHTPLPSSCSHSSGPCQMTRPSAPAGASERSLDSIGNASGNSRKMQKEEGQRFAEDSKTSLGIRQPSVTSSASLLSPSFTGREEGTASSSATPHKMTFWYNFIDPNHSRRLHPELPPKPVVDCSVPFNLLDETHQVRKFGVQKLGWDFLSMNEFVGAQEAVPYTESHHTWEIMKLWLIAMNVMQWNYFMARGQASGGIVGGGVRTRFAWNIAFFMSQLRMNIATVIGAGGYFYAYEWLYTHGPSCFRIRDPSPNAWKRPWEEGQSTYGARAVASIFPALGYAFYSGRFKRGAFWFTMTLSTSLYYEYARQNILSGTRLFYSYLANQHADREAGFGSLAPRLKRRVDPDTNRTESVAQFRHYRITTGEMQNTVWDNAQHETLPLHRTGMKLPNPYYNWKKAPQTYEKEKVKVKNGIWTLPSVLNARVLAVA